MLIEPTKQLSASIRNHDAETADHIDFLGYKMREDLNRHIDSHIDPIREKMFNEVTSMISEKYSFMIKRARRNIIRRYKNSITNSIAHMNYKKLKAGGKKLELHRDSDGNWLCTPKPVSPTPSFRIDTKPDPQHHADSTPLPDSTRLHSHSNNDDADSSEPMDLSTSKKHPRSHAANPEVHITKKQCEQYAESLQSYAKIRHLTATQCETVQCEKNGVLPALDFTDKAMESYAKMHIYLSVCNCTTCIKNLFEQKITSRNAPKCQCTTCQPYWFYEAGHISDLYNRIIKK